MSKIPNLSDIASADMFQFDMDFNDLDALLERESGFSSQPAKRFDEPTNTNTPANLNKDALPEPVNPYVDEFNKVLNDVDGDSLNVRTNDSNKPTQPNTDTYFDDFFSDDELDDTDKSNNKNTDKVDADDNNQALDTNALMIALNLNRELGLIDIPDDYDYNKLSKEDLEYFAEETKQRKFDEAIDYIREQVADDPYMSDLIDYAIEGKGFADLPKMYNILNIEREYEKLDLSNESIQVALISRMLNDNLNPKNPQHKELIDLIPAKIKYYKDNDVLKSKAIDAQKYFIDKQQAKRNEEFAKVEKAKQQQLEEQLRIQEDNKRWDLAFKKALKESNMSEDKKRAIVEQTRPYQTQDGTVLPLWKLKQQAIFEDPKLFQTFLRFMSNYDINENKFINTPTTDNNSFINKLTENLLNKQQQNKSTNTNNNATNNRGIPVYDPKSDV